MSSGALSGLLLNFMAAYPEVQLRIREGYSALLTDAVVDGELDFAIVGVDHREARVQVRPLIEEPLRLVVGTADAARLAAPVACREAAAMKLVFPTLDNPLRLLIEREFTRHGIPLQPALELDSLQATLAIVKAGGFATILTGSVISDVPDLVSAPLVAPTILRSLVVVQRLDEVLPGGAEALIEELKLLFADRCLGS